MIIVIIFKSYNNILSSRAGVGVYNFWYLLVVVSIIEYI